MVFMRARRIWHLPGRPVDGPWISCETKPRLAHLLGSADREPVSLLHDIRTGDSW